IHDAAQSRSLLNLATIEGFQANNRGLRTLVVGDDVSIRIHAIVAALQAANVFNSGPAGERLVLEKFYYQLCQLLLACITMVFFFDGPGREPIKRGVRVIYRPTWLEHRMKEMILAFGFYYYDAPGEAEAELAQLNKAGAIDVIITEDSDAFLFGAQCVIRTSGYAAFHPLVPMLIISRPSVQDKSLIFSADSIENTETVQLTRDGLLLCALLLGGDYHSGIPGAGIAIACALAAHGFGEQLVHIMNSFQGSDLSRHLSTWRNELRLELRTNSSGHLSRRHPRLADTIPDTFPDVRVVNLYLNPLTSRSTGFTGPLPSPQLWRPSEPSVPRLAAFCSAYFGWNGNDLLKKLNSTLWPGVAFKLM
ncbi:PIN domain-like protein, partial [Mycena polygramma]